MVYSITTACEKLQAVPSEWGKSPLLHKLEDEDITRTIVNLLNPKAVNDKQNDPPSTSGLVKFIFMACHIYKF